MKRYITYTAVAFFMAGMLSAQQIDINAMPKPGPTPTINIAKPQVFRLKNGLTVLVVENHKLPRVNISLSNDNPPVYEGDIVGVGEILGDQYDKGTQTMSKDEFNEKVDFMGARLSFYSGGASANTLSKYFNDVMGLMADALTRPNFKAEEVETSKNRTIEGLKTSEKSADAIAANVYSALVYGKNTALGEFETQESIAKITLQDVKDYYAKNFVPDNAYLTIVGDVKAKEVEKLVKKLYGGLKKSNQKFAVPAPAQNLATTEIDVVDVPNAVQSVVRVGNVIDLKMNNPQYFAASLANYVLGGGADSRLFMNLREKNAFTYGAYSNLTASKYSPRFVASSSVRNEVTDKAIAEFMNELQAIPTIKAEELANAKAKLKGSFIMSLERPETLARFAVNQMTQNLPDDFYVNYLKSIDGVTMAEASAAARKYILPGQSRIFVAGKAADIAENLDKLGYPVHYFDRNANPAAKPEVKQVESGVTTATIGEKYIAAIGGAAAVSKIKSTKMLATTKLQGMDMEMTSIQADGGKMAIEVKVMGNTMQKIVFDGTDGYMEAQGQKMPMPEEMKKQYESNKHLFPELTYGSADDGLQLKGREEFGGEDCYVVANDSKKSYYSVKTGLKVGEVISSPQGDVPSILSDYREVDGVKVPFKISQNMGGMDIDFEVKDYQFNQAKDADFK